MGSQLVVPNMVGVVARLHIVVLGASRNSATVLSY
jgi:hypothetical protein